MNNLYFACSTCKVFIDAGYRWAHWELEETGIVRRGEILSPDRVLDADKYWHPDPLDESSRWLREEVLPSVRLFLNEHREHAIVFGEDDFKDADPNWFLEWLQEGFLFDPLPRYCLERLRFQSWTLVEAHIKELKVKPVWWTDAELRDMAERWYKASLIRRQRGPIIRSDTEPVDRKV